MEMLSTVAFSESILVRECDRDLMWVCGIAARGAVVDVSLIRGQARLQLTPNQQ